jgi:hypothetical protein
MGKHGEVVEGLQIDFSDGYHDIAVNNNRRGTAKARSIAKQPMLWSESMEER